MKFWDKRLRLNNQKSIRIKCEQLQWRRLKLHRDQKCYNSFLLEWEDIAMLAKASLQA